MQPKRLAFFAALAGLAVLAAVPLAAHPPQYGHAGPYGRGGPFGRPYAQPMAYPRPMPDRHPGHDAQNAARREMRAGTVHSLRDIERHIVPMMPGMQYLGPEYDPEAMAYRLKFIRDGRVVFVDVDARTGSVLGRSR
jgi:hypothetical protein